MVYKGFVGGAYRSQSKIAAADECINWYVEKIDSSDPKSPAMLVGTPGLAVFVTLPTSPVQGTFEALGRYWAVAGGVLYEVLANGTIKNRGNVPSSTGQTDPAIFTCNNLQLLVAIGTGNSAWVLDLTTNVLTRLAQPGFTGASGLAFISGYGLATRPSTRQFTISHLLDLGTWDAIDVAVKEGGYDNIVTGFADHLEYWLFGEETSEVWWLSGNANFPFERIQGSFIEGGCAAALSVAKSDNSLMWLGRDARGQGVVYRANGYTPLRISTHALEFAIQGYPRIDDAIGSSHQFRGHPFYRLDFPSAKPAKPNGVPAGETWLYDGSTGLWHQRAFWNTSAGQARFEAHRGRSYSFAFGKHLLGDYQSGAIYEMNAAYLDDFGNPLRSVRTAPHQYAEGAMVFYGDMWFDMEVGDGQVSGVAPQAALVLSNDGGQTWGNEQYASLGPVGGYKQRVKYRRLGASRDRVNRLIISDPVPRFLVGAYYEAQAGGA